MDSCLLSGDDGMREGSVWMVDREAVEDVRKDGCGKDVGMLWDMSYLSAQCCHAAFGDWLVVKC